MSDPLELGKLAETNLGGLWRALPEAARVPGAVRLAAAVTAAGAGLASMAFRAGSGEASPWMAGRTEELDGIAERVLAQADGEAAAWAAAGDGDKQRHALYDLRVEVAEAALGALRITTVGAPETEPAQRTECAAAGEALRAGFRAAAQRVLADLESWPAGEEVDDRRAELAAMTAEVEALHAELEAALAEASA